MDNEITDQDLIFEENVLQNPYVEDVWDKYIQFLVSTTNSSSTKLLTIHERRNLPPSELVSISEEERDSVDANEGEPCRCEVVVASRNLLVPVLANWFHLKRHRNRGEYGGEDCEPLREAARKEGED